MKNDVIFIRSEVPGWPDCFLLNLQIHFEKIWTYRLNLWYLTQISDSMCNQDRVHWHFPRSCMPQGSITTEKKSSSENKILTKTMGNVGISRGTQLQIWFHALHQEYLDQCKGSEGWLRSTVRIHWYSMLKTIFHVHCYADTDRPDWTGTCQPQTLTVRIWLLCRAATVGKPGRP